MKKLVSVILLFTIGFLSITLKTFAYDSADAINIAMATDNNYVYPTVVSMTSILENKNANSQIHFYILLSSDLTNESKQNILNLKRYYDNCQISLIDMQNRYKSASLVRHLSTAAYYRLNLPSLLPNVDKILYLDGDTAVQQDLQELYNTNIDNYYIAGVRDLDALVERGDDYVKQFGINSCSQYINSGVLLMNLKKMRNEKLEEKFNEFIEKYHNPQNRLGIFHDQDVLNVVCYNNIYILPLKYNALVHQLTKVLENRYTSIPKDYYSKEEWDIAYSKPAVIHYSHKPWWQKLTIPFKETWWDYAKKTNIYNEIKKKYRYKDEVVSVALSTDNNYTVPTIVTLTSILENSNKDVRYDFYILLSGDFDNLNKVKIMNVKKKYKNCNIVLIDMKNIDAQDNVKGAYTSGHITTAAYYRLWLSNLLPNLNKVLYLDVDIIVKKDLYNMFKTDITDYYVAGVKGYNSDYFKRLAQRNGCESYAEMLGIRSLDQYVNSGVLLMNLDKMRNDNIVDSFNKLLKEKQLFCHDQDAINIVCYDKILHLNLKNNCMQHYFKWSNMNKRYIICNIVKNLYTQGEWENAFKDPIIVHYSSDKKPWIRKDIPNADLWWTYAEKAQVYS